MDDHLMLDFTTNLAQIMPSILESDYETRLATVLRLSKTSEELVFNKSRRLAGLDVLPNELEDERERK